MTLVLLVAVPLAAAAAILVAGGRLPRGAIALVGTAAPAFTVGIGVAMTQALMTGASELDADLGPWLPLRGAELALRADAGAMPLVLATAIAGVVVAVAAIGGVREDSARFFAALDVLVAGLIAIALSGSLVAALAAWGIAGVCGSLLASQDRDSAEGARDGAVALVLARAGDAALLVASLLILALFQTLDIDQVRGRLATIELAPETARAVTAASLVVVLASMSRAALAPFGVWLPSARWAPRPAVAAHALAVASGPILLLRLTGVLHHDAIVIASAIGGATALLASAATLGTVRREPWRTAAVFGAAVAALIIGPFEATVALIAAIAARVIGLCTGAATARWLSGAAAAAALAVSATLSVDVPATAVTLLGAAVLSAIGAGRRDGFPRVAAIAGLDGLAHVVERVLQGGAALVERGGEALIAGGIEVAGAIFTGASRVVRAAGAGADWAHQAMLVVAAIALVAFWVAR